jgi:hypothetical protein
VQRFGREIVLFPYRGYPYRSHALRARRPAFDGEEKVAGGLVNPQATWMEAACVR